MPTFKLIKCAHEVEVFQKKFCERISYEVPLGYFIKGDCYGFYDDGRLVGGFCLVHDIPYKLRSIQQVPEDCMWFKLPITRTAEFTGYFLDDKSHGLYFTYHLVKTIMLHKASWFVYSYPVSQVKLGGYYSRGNPVKIYTGAPKKLLGHTEGMEEEHVEALTKWGIVKIFLARTRRYVLKI